MLMARDPPPSPSESVDDPDLDAEVDRLLGVGVVMLDALVSVFPCPG
jgi:hypothetical protein